MAALGKPTLIFLLLLTIIPPFSSAAAQDCGADRACFDEKIKSCEINSTYKFSGLYGAPQNCHAVSLRKIVGDIGRYCVIENKVEYIQRPSGCSFQELEGLEYTVKGDIIPLCRDQDCIRINESVIRNDFIIRRGPVKPVEPGANAAQVDKNSNPINSFDSAPKTTKETNQNSLAQGISMLKTFWWVGIVFVTLVWLLSTGNMKSSSKQNVTAIVNQEIRQIQSAKQQVLKEADETKYHIRRARHRIKNEADGTTNEIVATKNRLLRYANQVFSWIGEQARETKDTLQKHRADVFEEARKPYFSKHVNRTVYKNPNIDGYECFYNKNDPNPYSSNLVHLWVWKIKKGSVRPGYQIHHIDFDKYNNDINNLEEVTPAEHAERHRGRYKHI